MGSKVAKWSGFEFSAAERLVKFSLHIDSTDSIWKRPSSASRTLHQGPIMTKIAPE